MTRFSPDSGLSRQEFLGILGAGAGALALADLGIARAADLGRGTWATGQERAFKLNAQNMSVNLGGRIESTLGYNGVLPGPELRLKEGDTLHATVNNQLTSDTSVHWHGIPLTNSMDGVPGLTQNAIKPGQTFDYRFKIPVSGTYWYHSHSSIQNDRGLYGPLIIEPQSEPLSYDREFVLMLDDWRGSSGRAESRLASSLYECDLATLVDGLDRPSSEQLPPAQPSVYPLFLINGKPPNAPFQMQVKRGDTIRLRLINASAGSVLRVAIQGHKMRVTHADGQPVKPVDVDVLDIGMAERYDVLVQANNPGTWQVAGWVNGQGVRTRAILHYQGSKSPWPAATFQPRELNGKLLTYDMLQRAGGVSAPSGKPDLIVPIGLRTRFGSFFLTYNNQIHDAMTPIAIPANKHIRFVFSNDGSTEVHPMHLHGNFFQVMNKTGNGPMKDTVMVFPFQTVTVDWTSNNPGLWMVHCHNLYHMLAGMMLILKVG